MLPLPDKTFSLKNINLYGLAFLAVTMLWLAREFIGKNSDSTKQSLQAKTEAIDYWRKKGEKDGKTKDSIAAYWQAKYIMEVEKNANYFRQSDSTNRSALEKPAKDLLKTIKQRKND